jgi:hypothetical protein
VNKPTLVFGETKLDGWRSLKIRDNDVSSRHTVVEFLLVGWLFCGFKSAKKSPIIKVQQPITNNQYHPNFNLCKPHLLHQLRPAK